MEVTRFQRFVRNSSDHWQWVAIGLLTLGFLSITGIGLLNTLPTPPPVPGPEPEPEVVEFAEPPKELMGWAGAQAAEIAWAANQHEFAAFKIAHIDGDIPQDNTSKRVVMWDAAKIVNGGKHLPTLRQEIGDCVGFGAANALRYLQAVHIVLYGDRIEWKEPFVPYHYAMGRNLPNAGNSRIRGPDGSLGSWQAIGLKEGGWIAADTPGLPAYSAAVARQWAVRLPQPEFIAIGKQHLVKTASRLRTAAEIRDAICNGYPVTIASDWGGKMRPPTIDGRLVNTKSDTWQHQMCVIGYDGTGAVKYWYVLNSWGPSAHGTPPDDAVPGGFWIPERDMEYIAKTGECYAISDVVGYPSRDWIIIEQKAAFMRHQQQIPQTNAGEEWREKVVYSLSM